MKIDKGIPRPRCTRTTINRTPEIVEMEVGDSIFIPGETVRGPIYKAAKNYERVSGRLFSGRTISGGVRIWRIA